MNSTDNLKRSTMAEFAIYLGDWYVGITYNLKLRKWCVLLELKSKKRILCKGIKKLESRWCLSMKQSKPQSVATRIKSLAVILAIFIVAMTVLLFVYTRTTSLIQTSDTTTTKSAGTLHYNNLEKPLTKTSLKYLKAEIDSIHIVDGDIELTISSKKDPSYVIRTNQEGLNTLLNYLNFSQPVDYISSTLVTFFTAVAITLFIFLRIVNGSTSDWLDLPETVDTTNDTIQDTD